MAGAGLTTLTLSPDDAATLTTLLADYKSLQTWSTHPAPASLESFVNDVDVVRVYIVSPLICRASSVAAWCHLEPVVGAATLSVAHRPARLPQMFVLISGYLVFFMQWRDFCREH